MTGLDPENMESRMKKQSLTSSPQDNLSENDGRKVSMKVVQVDGVHRLDS